MLPMMTTVVTIGDANFDARAVSFGLGEFYDMAVYLLFEPWHPGPDLCAPPWGPPKDPWKSHRDPPHGEPQGTPRGTPPGTPK